MTAVNFQNLWYLALLLASFARVGAEIEDAQFQTKLGPACEAAFTSEPARALEQLNKLKKSPSAKTSVRYKHCQGVALGRVAESTSDPAQKQSHYKAAKKAFTGALKHVEQEHGPLVSLCVDGARVMLGAGGSFLNTSLKLLEAAETVDTKVAEVYRLKSEVHHARGQYKESLFNLDLAVSHGAVANKMEPSFLGRMAMVHDQVLSGAVKSYAGWKLLLDANANYCDAIAQCARFAKQLLQWDRSAEYITKLHSLVRSGRCESWQRPGKTESHSTVEPWILTSMRVDHDVVTKIAMARAETFFFKATALNSPGMPLELPMVSFEAKAPMRLGYYSSSGFTMGGVNELIMNEFSYFEGAGARTACYAIEYCTRTPVEERYLKNCGSYHCVPGMQPRALAERVNSDGVHILLELTGWAARNDMTPLVYRPAPVSIHYLEDSGILGSRFIDYRLSTPVVTPPEYAHHLTEHALLLRRTYMTNAMKFQERHMLLEASALLPTSQQAPESKVLCFLQKPTKIGKEDFLTWLEILKAVPESILRFLGRKDDATHLKKVAAKHGVSGKRLVPFPHMSPREYQRELAACTFQLDTQLYSSQKSCLDSLWAGVPVLHYPGPQFASRAGSALSLLHGLAPMVVHSGEEYTAIATRMLRFTPAENRRLKQIALSMRVNSRVFAHHVILGDMQRAYEGVLDSRLAFGGRFHLVGA